MPEVGAVMPEVGAVMPKAFKLFAGGKRTATTGKGTPCDQHPGRMTACIPPGCVIRLEQFLWWRFAYHPLIAAIPPGYKPKQLKLGSTRLHPFHLDLICDLPILERLAESQQDIAIGASPNFRNQTVFNGLVDRRFNYELAESVIEAKLTATHQRPDGVAKSITGQLVGG